MTELTDIVKNWILKANNDFKTGKDEMATEEPATDTICFHMQQCVEKYLKAYLVFHKVDFRKTHDIAELIELCKERNSFFTYFLDEFTKNTIGNGRHRTRFL